MATSTKSSVDSVRQGLVSYISRPLSDFNKYEAMEMFELLQNTSHDNKHQMEGFYKVAYQTARKRMDLPKDQFQSLLLRLIGDKDHEKVLDIVSKVEKHYRWDGRGKTGATPYEHNTEHRPRALGVRCFYCHRFGHIREGCEGTGWKMTRKSPSSKVIILRVRRRCDACFLTARKVVLLTVGYCNKPCELNLLY